MIPIINFKTLYSSKTLRTLDHACRTWGAFYLVEHNLTRSPSNTLFNEMASFFSLSNEEKKLSNRTKINPWGFYNKELTKNIVDLKEIYDLGNLPEDELNIPWPSNLGMFKKVTTEHYQKCHSLSMLILSAMASNLGVSEKTLQSPFMEKSTSFLRLNYYPQQPNSDNLEDPNQFGVNEHTDSGAITLLSMDGQPGLEIKHDDIWQPVKNIKGALLVNLGDIFQVWSNDRYKAALHRVKASKNEPRFSAPFFLNPSYQTNYQPLNMTYSASNFPKYKSINWGDFRRQRTLGDYADYGKEIQISDFKI